MTKSLVLLVDWLPAVLLTILISMYLMFIGQTGIPFDALREPFLAYQNIRDGIFPVTGSETEGSILSPYREAMPFCLPNQDGILLRTGLIQFGAHGQNLEECLSRWANVQK